MHPFCLSKLFVRFSTATVRVMCMALRILYKRHCKIPTRSELLFFHSALPSTLVSLSLLSVCTIECRKKELGGQMRDFQLPPRDGEGQSCFAGSSTNASELNQGESQMFKSISLLADPPLCTAAACIHGPTSIFIALYWWLSLIQYYLLGIFGFVVQLCQF